MHPEKFSSWDTQRVRTKLDGEIPLALVYMGNVGVMETHREDLIESEI